MTESQFYEAAKNMRSGGSFAATIAQAYFIADYTNQRILVTAFAHLFERFAPVDALVAITKATA